MADKLTWKDITSSKKLLSACVRRENISPFNPLVHSVHFIGHLTKILILILEGIIKKNSYERRNSESVDEKILS